MDNSHVYISYRSLYKKETKDYKTYQSTQILFLIKESADWTKVSMNLWKGFKMKMVWKFDRLPESLIHDSLSLSFIEP